MTEPYKIIEVKESVFADNDREAARLRTQLKQDRTFLLNLMSSPGSGKTTTLLRTLEALKDELHIGVMEADIDSDVDAKTIADAGVKSIQLHTGGMCHLDASMTEQGLKEIGTKDLDLVVLENVGNLVCPAEFDTGAVKNAMILSVPEGHDKPLKYPLIFTVCDALIINKIDVLPYFDFDMEKVVEYARMRNPKLEIFPISAKTGMGVDNLLEMLVLTAEVGELKANPNRAASGAVVEARLDKGRGPIATLLVQNGTLHQGDIIIAGTAVGRVRAMMSDKGQKLTTAGPSVPVEITGLGEVPEAGAHFNAVADERLARELVEQRKEEEKRKANAPITKVSLEDLFSQIQAGEMKNLNIIVKADVMGSVEAVKASLEKISNDEVRVRVIHGAVGAINESDVMLAATSNAIIVGFNVRPDAAARDSAARNHVDMRMYRVIYDAIDEIEAAMKGMLAPKFREAIIGHAEIRQTYKVSSVGTVAGCYVTDGKIQRACDVRIVRDGIVVHEGHLASLQRFKDSVKEVAQGYECGLSFEKYNDIKVGDIVEAYVMEQIEQ